MMIRVGNALVEVGGEGKGWVIIEENQYLYVSSENKIEDYNNHNV